MNFQDDKQLTADVSRSGDSHDDPHDGSGPSPGSDAKTPTRAGALPRRRWKFYVVVMLFVVTAPLLAFTYLRPSVENAPISKPTVADSSEPGIRTTTLDEALDVARKGLARLEAELVDYRGRLVKRELVGRTLSPETELQFKIRTRRTGDIEGVTPQAMAVYLRFIRPESMNGREVIWVEDRNEGKLVAHDTGLAALIKLSLDPKGFLAMQGNRYPLTEIGFKNLVRQLIVRSAMVEQEGGAEVTFVESYKVGDRDCLLIQVRPHATNGEVNPNTKLDFSLAEIAIDKERQVPLRYVAYGIPRKEQDSPPLLEEYTYYDVELNVGLSDAEFDVENPEYNFP